MKPIISIENIGKRYRIRNQAADAPTNFREVLANLPRRLLQGASKEEIADFWALRDVSFDIMPGERVGIIGRNGAGKSTLLKILSRITEPTTGRITLRGRVVSLLEVGTGFHPELTGRENIFLNGAILGMNKAEVQKKFDEIVDFSGVEKFLDTPVKRYSSGMYVRLGFAVAAHLEPEILVVDEVLAVGDMDFQKKCLGKMEEVSSQQGRTVLFVSHNMNAINTLCPRSVVLDDGQIIKAGDTGDAIAYYGQKNIPEEYIWERDFADAVRYGNQKVYCVKGAIRAYSPAGESRDKTFYSGDDLEIDVTIRAKEYVVGLNVAYILYAIDGERVVDANLSMLGQKVAIAKEETSLFTCRLRTLMLTPGKYLVAFWLGEPNQDFDGIPKAFTLTVHEENPSKYAAVYPGKYRCDFTISLQSINGVLEI